LEIPLETFVENLRAVLKDGCGDNELVTLTGGKNRINERLKTHFFSAAAACGLPVNGR
jgi:hypothetical protein